MKGGKICLKMEWQNSRNLQNTATKFTKMGHPLIKSHYEGRTGGLSLQDRWWEGGLILTDIPQKSI